MTIDSLDKKECTGCLACYNACPQDAISLITNYEGFIEPIIETDRCINCGVCGNVCAKLGEKNFHEVKDARAVICNDEIRENCSSGGVWGQLAFTINSQGGVVYGAVLSEDLKSVKHARLTKKDELKKSFGSKYLQSFIGKTYADVKNDLITEKKVLFSGCPCQVDGLKKFLKKDYDNLITVDILCHGVASPWAYMKFVEEITDDEQDNIKGIKFRSKKFGWSTHLSVVTEDSEKISPYSDDYFHAFLWGYSQREACFSCPYATANRVGDITIGDFWEINKVFHDWSDKKGTSLLLVNTEKGRSIVDDVEALFIKNEICTYSDVIEKTGDVNWALIKPGNMPQYRNFFFHRLHMGDSFSTAFKLASTGQFDVGIYGWWNEIDGWTNYGSVLTYYALKEYILSLGLSVCMIPSPYDKSKTLSEFIKKHDYRLGRKYSIEEMFKHNEYINTFLVGSDQLWFYDCYKTWNHTLFLDFVSDQHKKIAYATSFGHEDPKIPLNEQEIIKSYLNQFDGISCRENSGVDYLSNKLHIENATHVLDPVFIVDKQRWDDLADESKHIIKHKYIFAYILDPDKEKINALKHLSSKLGLDIVSVTDRQYNKKEKELLLEKCGVVRDASISDYLNFIKNSAYVLTDSYHGTCFSIIYNKPFTTIINTTRGKTRFDMLDEMLGVGNRYVKEATHIINNAELLLKPNYQKLNQQLKTLVNYSRAWINYMLIAKNQKKVLKKTDEVMGGKVLEYEAKTIYRDGIKEGIEQVATRLLQRGESVEQVMDDTGLPSDAIENLLKSITVK